ncbi:MAG: NADPH-dependent assimilatory sulfite reductase hemoprotein subunit [Nitrospirota bacterium]|nr:NADPH-dependent assimilatory sulfite reductase hemoprotein subunit [Nitrospirota bacterium]
MHKDAAPSKIEMAKENSFYLRRPLFEELGNQEEAFSDESAQVIKFHGVYQQDDRDQRKSRRNEGLEPAYRFMVRVGSAGGAYTAEQLLAMAKFAEEYANGTLRLASRQSVQLHGVLKGGLKPLLSGLSKHLLSSFAKCGDVVRNVTLCPAPPEGALSKTLLDIARTIEAHFRPKSSAYLEVWLDGKLAVSTEGEEEPLYGRAYLPRKFKIGISSPFDNCIDVYANDIGIVPVENGRLEGFVLLVGGGIAFSHGERSTYPRLAEPLGFVVPDDLLAVLEAIFTIQRDFGDRSKRNHARMKYTLDRLGLLGFKDELERRFGKPLAPARKPAWKASHDHLGWQTLEDGRLMLGLSIPSGRVQDTPGHRYKSAVMALLEAFRPDARITPQQNMLLVGILPGDKRKVEECLRDFGVPLAESLKPLERAAMACPALPTCGLAIAEAERAFPGLLEELLAVLEELGLQDEPLAVRMTGCPNNCVRPLLAEVGIVGRGLDSYNIYLGASHLGTRLGALFAEKVPRKEIAEALRPVLYLWSRAKLEGERFGDFYNRVGLTPLRSLAVREVV